MIDFLVIGGGVAGLTAAAHLAPLGSVVVLEREAALGMHASGRSAAIYIERYGNPVVRALNTASLPGLIAADVLRPRAFLLLARGDQEAQFEAERAGFAGTQISVGAGAAMFPILDQTTCGYVASVDQAFDLDTDRLMQHFRKTARGHGARIICGSPVTALARDGRGWRVTTPDEVWEARRVVNAAGAWADDLARLAGIAPVGLQPYRRSIARLPAPGGHDTKDWPFVDGVGESWYAKPDAGGWLVSPSEEDPVEPHDAWADDMVIAEGLDRYGGFVTEAVTRVQTTWAGLRSFAPDRALVIGPDLADPSFLWCSGQGGYGFQTAVAAGAALADGVAGRSPDLPPDMVRALSPARFS
ncbi:FAD-binding oxidoreductase [Actibacterium sp. 188UL27-1]|uniref:NAD(P)/FAD-dependent oxidoreductase n=1 Tax=Actibacterium sp. 188UL27-1 TaxID=2786961 RepID=UPI00195EDD42|nr:FAD-dependent oxidoreductase [Actibacterium sp. 188UL27-1]MBM7066625.1 FAD-binding oxidoreductase [Actibacterium sp. 188UL27-1]